MWRQRHRRQQLPFILIASMRYFIASKWRNNLISTACRLNHSFPHSSPLADHSLHSNVRPFVIQNAQFTNKNAKSAKRVEIYFYYVAPLLSLGVSFLTPDAFLELGIIANLLLYFASSLAPSLSLSLLPALSITQHVRDKCEFRKFLVFYFWRASQNRWDISIKPLSIIVLIKQDLRHDLILWCVIEV